METSPGNNVLRLAFAQALMLSAIVMSMAVGGIIGALLAASRMARTGQAAPAPA